MRRSIDDHPADPADVPPGLDGELTPVSWAVAISDDYDDAEPRVVLRAALRDALREIGEPPE